LLLLEGARVSRQSVGTDGPSRRFVQMSEAIIETYTRGSETPPAVQTGAAGLSPLARV
jgi:hypothetical protein